MDSNLGLVSQCYICTSQSETKRPFLNGETIHTLGETMYQTIYSAKDIIGYTFYSHHNHLFLDPLRVMSLKAIYRQPGVDFTKS